MAPEDTHTAADAFAALGNELRLSIVRVLADSRPRAAEGLTFSEIYDRIDIDSTSRLSYHLDHLEGPFVRRAERGYRLTRAGDRIVRTIRSGLYSDHPSFDTTDVQGRCPECDESRLTAAYRDPFLRVSCSACETTVVTFNLPPAASVDRTAREVLDSCNDRVHREYAMALSGTCPLCAGVTDRAIERQDGPAAYMAIATCTCCQLRLFAPLQVRLFSHPAVVSLYWQHDIDSNHIPLWNLPAYIEDWEITPIETDPYRLDVRVTYEDETLSAIVDHELRVSVQSGTASAAVDADHE